MLNEYYMIKILLKTVSWIQNPLDLLDNAVDCVMSTRLDNNLEGPKPPDCEIIKTNDSNSKQYNNQTTNEANTQDSQHSTDTPHILAQDSVTPEVSGNIIIDFENLKMTCDRHFLNYIICKQGIPQLVRESSTGFATNLAVTCGNCKDNEKKLLNSVSYLTSKLNTIV